MEPNTLLWIGGCVVITALGVKYYIQKKQTNGEGETNLPIEEESVEGIEIPVTPFPNTSAKEAFLKNLTNLIPLFALISEKETRIPAQKIDLLWDETIKAIENKELIDIREVSKQRNRWHIVLASWGISCEKCLEFTATAEKQDWYALEDGSKPTEGKRYSVISYPCILTNVSDGSKTVILRGVVSELLNDMNKEKNENI